MKSIELLDKALESASAAEWQRRLGLSDAALYVARSRGCLSPAIAGALAEQLGENVERWLIVAALEGERESACKDRMLERYDVH
ncbi:hypothetical protein [Hydrogenophaga sp. PML113]|uniref:hypothetical protein n=1 Tax=Hydrogenophaga sp. PML113 TaxID=1899350 RepID=UPI0009F2CB01|nr:hypothetical protein [Hydrogenophaga sp. PML113]